MLVLSYIPVYLQCDVRSLRFGLRQMVMDWEKCTTYIDLENLVSTIPRCVCPKVKDMDPFFLQVIEMSEMISLKMGVKCNTSSSLNMGV